MELMMGPWETNDPRLFPLWIHTLVPKHKHRAGAYNTAWQGRMWNMKAHVTDEMDRTRQAITNALRVVAQVCDELNEQMELVRMDISEGGRQLAAIAGER